VVGLGLAAAAAVIAVVAALLSATWAGTIAGYAFSVAFVTLLIAASLARRPGLSVLRELTRRPLGHHGWLAAARASDDGLHLPALHRKGRCELVLGFDCATVRAGWSAAPLAWHEYRAGSDPYPLGDPLSSAHKGDTWSITAASIETPTSVGIELTGRCIEATTLVRREWLTWKDRLPRITPAEVRLPLVGRWSIDHRLDAERGTVIALCQLLAQRPDLRRGLDDPSRSRRLLEDLRAHPLNPLGPPDLGTRRQFEIGGALKRLGYVHPLAGRPLPGEPMPPRTEVIARVAAELRRSPFARDVFISTDQIHEVVASRYFVAPWPFGALFH
jgi:hypothetical protein